MRIVIMSIMLLAVYGLVAVEVAGQINMDTVWSPVNNPYEVVGNIEIAIGNTLTLEPGVRVDFMGSWSLLVLGTLHAVGTETDSIYFSSGQFDPETGDWISISFEDSASINNEISYARIDHNQHGIRSINGASVAISNVTICDNSYCGIYCAESAIVQITNAHLKGESEWGVICNNTSPEIINTVITDKNVGVYAYNCAAPVVEGCNIYNNNWYGVRGSYSASLYIHGSEIHNNITGAISSSSGNIIEISGSNLSDNGQYGIKIVNPQSLTIIDNVISGNEEDGIEIWKESSAAVLLPFISGNQLIENGTGLKCLENVAAVICNNAFSGNSSHGIYLSTTGYQALGEICYNVIEWSGEAGIYNDSGAIDIYKNTISYNGQGLHYNNGNLDIILDNIFYGNETGVLMEQELPELSYNLFWLNTQAATGELPANWGDLNNFNNNGDACDTYYNLFLDPVFLDPATGDYHLQNTSPAIDAGDPATFFYDHDATIGDMGAYYYQATSNDVSEIIEPADLLLRNYPNPFNPVTEISFHIEPGETGILKIFDLRGRLILQKSFKAGDHRYIWDAATEASGVYFCQVQTKYQQQIRKLLLLK
ncbi:MAG: right-handed parallel beta-helix repeat-containing protein [Candidatus Cloacimonetes bacterium]|nr:right-handed parallel beta-helix repeat-containing protein [Candidatus Cloacimonadota bacterium]